MCDYVYDCGGATASTSFQSTYNSLVSATSSFISTNSQSTASSAMGMQATAPVAIGGSTYPPCSITASQTMTIVNSPSGKLSPTQQTELQNQITQQLQTAASQHSSAQSSTFGGGATSSDNTDINQNIQQIVNQNFENDNYSSVVAQTCGSQSQGAIVIAGDCHSPITLTQDFTATAIAQNLLTPILTTLGGMGSTTTSNTAVVQTTAATTTGPFQSFANMFSSFGVIGGIICLLCVLASLAGCAFMVFMMFGPKGGG